MTTVVPFRQGPGPRRKAAAGPCEIVIFPGVRIERHEDADVPDDYGARDDRDRVAGGPTG